MFRLFSSLRARLLLLVLLAVIPALVLIVHSNQRQRRQELADAQKETLALARTVANLQKSVVESGCTLVSTLAQMPQVKDRDAAGCNALFANLLATSTRYGRIILVNADGVPHTGFPPLTEPVAFADRAWFQEILKSKKVTVSEYLFGRASRKPVLVFAAPVFKEPGELTAVVAASLNLGWLHRLIAQIPLATGETVVLLDRGGLVLARYPDPEGLVGRSLPQAPLTRAILASEEGVVEMPGLDGVARVIAFSTLSPQLGGINIAVTIPREVVYAEARRELTLNLIALGLVALLALNVAWFGGEILVRRPVHALLRVSRQIQEGDLSARSGLTYGSGEIDQLARAFDEAATALQRREAQRREAEDALRQSEELLRNTFASIKDGLSILDGEMTIIHVNPALEEMFADSLPLVGKKCYEAYHGRKTPCDDCPTLRALKTGEVHYQLKTLGELAKEPGRWIEIHAFPLRNGATGEIYGVIEYVQDVTERKRAEEEKAELEAQLLQAQKMEAVGRLAGGVAHDFNNLLGVIMGHSEMMMMDLDADHPLYSYGEAVRNAADRAASLTSQLLAFSRKQILKPKVINLNEVVRNLEKMLPRLLGEDIEIAAILQPGLEAVKVDPGQMEQVLMNLAVNARDAMPQGGKLTVETANVQLDEDYSRRHPYIAPGPYVMLAVSDNGAGMDQETQARIFEPFFTTKEEGKGTGLGLATVYGIVKQSNGSIEVYSEPGQGTTFKIYFPQVREAVEQLETEAAPATSLAGSETILVVEDEESLLEMTCKALRRQGYTVLEARQGAEALALGGQHRGPIHLLLTDVVMPQMGGRELAGSLAALYPELKVIYMSGYTEDAIMHHGVLDATLNFIAKPFGPLELARKVREVLDRR